MAKLLIIIGLVCILAGVVWLLVDQAGISRFLGNLPGDFHWTKGNMSFHFPLATSLLISVVLTIVLTLFLHR